MLKVTGQKKSKIQFKKTENLDTVVIESIKCQDGRTVG